MFMMYIREIRVICGFLSFRDNNEIRVNQCSSVLPPRENGYDRLWYEMRSRQTWLWILLGTCPLLIAAGVFLGDGWTRPWTLFDADRAGVLELRLWRVALGAVVGASLSVAGAILQTLLRNPLAEPYVLGLSAGAGLATAGCIILGGVALGVWIMPAAGFVGAMISMLIVYRLARAGAVTSPHTLILAGVIWGAICGSFLMFLVSQASAEGLQAVMWWLLGDLQVYDVRLVTMAFALMAVAFVAVSFFGRRLNVLLLGEETASHVGLDPERTKIVLLILASILTATAVSVSGLIAFVGLVSPHAARALVGPDHRRLLPVAALGGAAFLVWADGIGRTLLFPVEIPVGVLTALTGGPFFLILLKLKQKEIWKA